MHLSFGFNFFNIKNLPIEDFTKLRSFWLYPGIREHSPRLPMENKEIETESFEVNLEAFKSQATDTPFSHNSQAMTSYAFLQLVPSVSRCLHKPIKLSNVLNFESKSHHQISQKAILSPKHSVQFDRSPFVR